MKRIAILVILGFAPMPASSQKIDRQELSFDYISLPSYPLAGDIHNFNSQVELAYEKDVIAAKNKAKTDYEKAVAEYKLELTAAENRYNLEYEAYTRDMDEYQKKSTVSKIVEEKVLEQRGKPVPPVLNKPVEPRYQEPETQMVFDRNLLASNYLNLEGFNNSPDHAVKITVTLDGFEYLEPELRSSEETVVNTQNNTSTLVTTYWYVIKYRHPMELKIELPDGKIIQQGSISQFSVYNDWTSNTAKDSYPVFDKMQVVKQLEVTVVENQMRAINQIINTEHGYVKTKRTTVLYRVEPKKFTYDDFQEAYEYAYSGYNLMVIDSGSAHEKLNRAIQIWEKAITEYIPEAKKVRIDEDVAKAARLNLAEAYLWTDNFEKADQQLNKTIGMHPSYRDKAAVEDMRNLLYFQQYLWKANH